MKSAATIRRKTINLTDVRIQLGRYVKRSGHGKHRNLKLQQGENLITVFERRFVQVFFPQVELCNQEGSISLHTILTDPMNAPDPSVGVVGSKNVTEASTVSCPMLQ
jgi:hypothetical protein